MITLDLCSPLCSDEILSALSYAWIGAHGIKVLPFHSGSFSVVYLYTIISTLQSAKWHGFLVRLRANPWWPIFCVKTQKKFVGSNGRFSFSSHKNIEKAMVISKTAALSIHASLPLLGEAQFEPYQFNSILFPCAFGHVRKIKTSYVGKMTWDTSQGLKMNENIFPRPQYGIAGRYRLGLSKKTFIEPAYGKV